MADRRLNGEGSLFRKLVIKKEIKDDIKRIGKGKSP
jgi:hypothetical protein